MIQMIARDKYETYIAKLNPKNCILCDLGKQIVIKEFKLWTWIINLSPYWEYHTMLIPKRHAVNVADLNMNELYELGSIYTEILDKLKVAGFKHSDGKLISKYLVMIRTRFDGVDYSTDIARPDHLHIHFLPDRKGMLTPLLNDKAYKIPLKGFLAKLR